MLKILLINNLGKATLDILGIEGYEKNCINLTVAGMGCLESGKGSSVLGGYLIKYACKGGEASASHETTANTLTDHYCKNDDNSEKGFRNLMGKHMNFVSGSMLVSRNQALYFLGGGQLKRNTDGAPIKFSVTAIGLGELVPAKPDKNGGNLKSFTWQNIVTRYNKRSAEFELLNLYQ